MFGEKDSQILLGWYKSVRQVENSTNLNKTPCPFPEITIDKTILMGAFGTFPYDIYILIDSHSLMVYRATKHLNKLYNSCLVSHIL